MIPDLKPYPEYKEAGQPWAGQVPEHWGQRRMKFLFKERKAKGFPDEPLLAATQSKGVVRKEDYGSRTVTATKDFHLLKLVNKGDFVISLRSFEGGLELAHCQGIISPAYTILVPMPEASQTYYSLLFKSATFISGMKLFITGIREGQNIDYERLSRAYVPLPPADEQYAIGRFLAWASWRLQRAMNGKQKVIALLKEQKQALIHRAVTRGLDRSASLKPSGIPGLGNIPRHWRVVRNLALFSHRVDRGIPGLPILQVSLRSGVTEESLDQFGRAKRLIADHTKYKLVRRHDLAYNTMRMWQGAVGVSSSDGLVSPAYVVITPREDVDSCYYEFVFRTAAYKEQMNRYSTGIVTDRNRLYWESFKQMPNILPPVKEQKAICDHIREETRGLNVAIFNLSRDFHLLREYRTRLVADVITGKLDVREAATRLPDEAAPDIDDLSDETELVDEDIAE